MSPDKAELEHRYSKFSNARLIEMLSNQHEYTPEALEVLKEEINRRKISAEDVHKFHNEQETQLNKALHNAYIPLQLWEKVVCFVGFFLPPFILHAFMLNYHEDSQMIKIKQSRFFRIAGALSIFLTVIVSIYFTFSDFLGYGLFIILFIIAYKIERILISRPPK